MELSNKEKAIKVLAQPELWMVAISPTPYLVEQLSEREREVLFEKVTIVEKSAKRMLAGMVKGTIKYPDGDNWILLEWFNYAREEAEDFVNYLNLMEEEVVATSEKANTSSS